MSKVKPCPFCGFEAVVVEIFERYRVECSGCDVLMSATLLDKEHAIRNWNTRFGNTISDPLPPAGFATISYTKEGCIITPYPPIFEEAGDE